MRLERTWPGWLAALFLVFGLHSLWERYPRPQRVSQGAGLYADSALPAALRSLAVAASEDAAAADSADIGNPFRLAAARPAPGGTGAGTRTPKPPPARAWKLKGMAGNAVATVVDSLGIKHFLRVGDSLGGMRLLEIHSNRVVMQDAAGRFELQPEP